MNSVPQIIEMIKVTAEEENINFEKMLSDIGQTESNLFDDLARIYKTILELNTIAEKLDVSLDYLLNIFANSNNDDSNSNNLNESASQHNYMPSGNNPNSNKSKYYYLCYNDEYEAIKYMNNLIIFFNEIILKRNLCEDKKKQEIKNFQESFYRFRQETNLKLFLEMREKDFEYDQLIKDSYNLIQYCENSEKIKDIFSNTITSYGMLADEIDQKIRSMQNDNGLCSPNNDCNNDLYSSNDDEYEDEL